jgi:ketosteroid isomerase-like protein
MKTSLRLLALICILSEGAGILNLGSVPARCANPPMSDDSIAVKQQMLALRKAELQYNTDAAAKLLHDDFALSAADGTLYSKQRFLTLVGDKSNPLEVFEYSEMQIHVYGTTAVVFSRLHEKGFMNGKPYELNGRSMWTWIKGSGGWVCVAAHD